MEGPQRIKMFMWVMLCVQGQILMNEQRVRRNHAASSDCSISGGLIRDGKDEFVVGFVKCVVPVTLCRSSYGLYLMDWNFRDKEFRKLEVEMDSKV